MAIFVKFLCTITGAIVGFASVFLTVQGTAVPFIALGGMGVGIWLGLSVGRMIVADAPKPPLPK